MFFGMGWIGADRSYDSLIFLNQINEARIISWHCSTRTISIIDFYRRLQLIPNQSQELLRYQCDARMNSCHMLKISKS